MLLNFDISDDNQNNDFSQGKLAGIVVGSMLFIMSIIFGLKLFRWRKKLEEPDIFWLKPPDHKREKEDMDLPTFDLSTIVYALINFLAITNWEKADMDQFIRVYLQTEPEIAVKRLSKNADQGLQEFKTEVQLIVKL